MIFRVYSPHQWMMIIHQINMVLSIANTQVVNGQIPESTKRKGNNSIGIREERSQTRSLSCPHADLASLCRSSIPVVVPPMHPPLIHFAPAPSGCVKPASEPPSAMLKSLPVYLTAFLRATPADGPSPLWLMPPRRTMF